MVDLVIVECDHAFCCERSMFDIADCVGTVLSESMALLVLGWVLVHCTGFCGGLLSMERRSLFLKYILFQFLQHPPSSN